MVEQSEQDRVKKQWLVTSPMVFLDAILVARLSIYGAPASLNQSGVPSVLFHCCCSESEGVNPEAI